MMCSSAALRAMVREASTGQPGVPQSNNTRPGCGGGIVADGLRCHPQRSNNGGATPTTPSSCGTPFETQATMLVGGAADSNHDCLGHDGARRVSELSARATARLAGTRTPHPGRVQPYRYHGGGNHFRWVTTGGWELEEPAAASLRSCIRLQSFRHQRHETLADCLDGLHIH
jgi:hypothetical protein